MLDNGVEPPPRAGIVCTLKVQSKRSREAKEECPNVIETFVSYHLQKGFAHIWLYFDDYEDSSSNQVKEFPSTRVTIIQRKRSEAELAWKQTCRETLNRLGGVETTRSEVVARQILNAEETYRLSVEAKPGAPQKVDYLIHIDSDELFYTASASIHEHFSWLREQRIDHMTYVNHEAIPEKVDIRNYFTEVTLFRKHHLTLPVTPSVRKATTFWTSRTNHHQYLLFYDNGKSSVRVSSDFDATPASVHSWTLTTRICKPMKKSDKKSLEKRKAKYRTALFDVRNLDVDVCIAMDDPCILHYPVCGLRWFLEKYEILGNFPLKWSSPAPHMKGIEMKDDRDMKPVEPVVTKIAPSFHLDAREAAKEGLNELETLFRSQILLDDSKELKLQMSAGVCMRIEHIQKLFNKGKMKLHDESRILLVSGTSTESVERKDSAEPSNVSAEFSQSDKNINIGPVQFSDNQKSFDKAWMLAEIARKFLQ